MKPKSWRIGLTGAAVLALTLAACSSGTADGNGSGNGNGSTGGDDTAERIYVEALNVTPEGMTVHFAPTPIGAMFSSQIYDPLIRISPEFEMTPGLAESWDLSDDGLELVLNLRDGVTWHDGEPFTAEDVKFNFDEIMALHRYGSLLINAVESTEIRDESTVVVNFSEPFGPTLPVLADLYILPKHVYEGTDYVTNPANMAPIGTGAMKFESYTDGDEVVLAKNENYWDGEVAVDRAFYPIIGDPDSRANALFAGELDRAAIDPSQQGRVADSEHLHHLDNESFKQYMLVMFNSESEYFADAEVRAAVFAALNREQILQLAAGGLGSVAQGFFPEELSWALNDDIHFDTDFPHDLDAINAVLDEHYPRGADGTRFTIDLDYISEQSHIAAASELAKSMLDEVGIAVNLVGSVGLNWIDKVYTQREYDLTISATVLGGDPSTSLVPWYICNPEKVVGWNPTGVCDEELDAAADRARTTIDLEERGEAMGVVQERARELMFHAPLVWYHGSFSTVSTERWANVDGTPKHAGIRPWTEMEWVGN